MYLVIYDCCDKLYQVLKKIFLFFSFINLLHAVNQDVPECHDLGWLTDEDGILNERNYSWPIWRHLPFARDEARILSDHPFHRRIFENKNLIYKEFILNDLKIFEKNKCYPFLDYHRVVLEFLRELTFLEKLKDRKKIVQVIAWSGWEGVHAPGIYFRFSGKNLKHWLKHHSKPLEELLFKKIFIQIVCGLKQLHQEVCVHTDLNPEHVLIDEQTQVTLTGLSHFHYLKECQGISYDPSGCLYYRSPELILRGPFGPSTDMFSLGCLGYEMLTGEILFPQKSEREHLIAIFLLSGSPGADRWPEAEGRFNYWPGGCWYADQRKDFFKKIKNLSSNLCFCLSDLLALPPQERPSAEEMEKRCAEFEDGE